jgi:cytoskeleton protein RodZ
LHRIRPAIDSEDMESVGQKLREARLQLGFSLERISASTRISVKLLQAIEDDDLSRFSSAFFYKSFVSQFAQEVQIQGRELTSSIEAATNTIPEPLIPGQGSYLPPKIPALRVSRVSSSNHGRLIYPVASLAVMLVACCALYALWESSKSNLQPAAPTEKPPVTSAPAPKAEAASPTAPSAPPDTPSTSIDAIRLELSAIEPTWLSMVADGRPAFSGILDTAETRVLEGHETARIRTGNAGGVNVVFNGKTLGTLGERGQVETVVFTKDNYEIIDPAPHIALTHFNPSGE